MQTSALSATNMTMLSLSQIIPGNNPRTHFDQAEMDELVASIHANGILQPILVRMTSEGYVLVAGERRYRAALQIYGTEGTIPAVVREMSNEEADAAALIENSVRSDMSVTEEAIAAGRVLDKQNGNREEAAAVIGWPISKLNRRLALLNLTEKAMSALNKREIMVGHAELLAAVPKEKQDKALANIIEKKRSVQEVRDMLATASTEFSKAIFDTASCSGCQHNSNVHATLFSVAVEQGRCTNGECFKSKTASKIGAIKADTEEEYPNVRLIEVGDPANYTTIKADGDLGVGTEQMEACKGCGNFGATVSAIPGEEGRVERGICFDSGCHQKKVSLRIKTERAGRETENSADNVVAPKTNKATSNEKTKLKKEATASALSEKVKEYRRKSVWNITAENELRLQPAKASSFILDLFITGHGSKVSSTILTKVYNQISGDNEYGNDSNKGNPDKAHALASDHKRQLFTEAAVSAVTGLGEDRVKGLLTFLDADLGKHWTVNSDFLNLLTKSEIEAVCTDIGIAASMTDFKKIIGGKKDEAVKAIMASGFDFIGKIPKILTYAPEL